jgi:hypothetical protein
MVSSLRRWQWKKNGQMINNECSIARETTRGSAIDVPRDYAAWRD